MVTTAVGFRILVVHFVARYFLAKGNSLQHGTVGVPATASVVYFARTGILVEMPEHIHQVPAMNIVPNLLAFIAENSVLVARYSAFHQVR